MEDNPIKTLKEIAKISHNFQESKFYVGTIHKAIKDFSTIKQHDREKTVDYAKRFKTCKDVMEAHYGKLDMTHAMKKTGEYLFAQTTKDNKKLWMKPMNI